MKKKVITIGMLMMSGLVFSQVGIGIKTPHRSALLELKAPEGAYKGVLIPRIGLRDLTDVSDINQGDVATSLLVFNTTTNDVLNPGFYYWTGTKWVRLINNQDIIENIDKFPRNKVLEVRGDVLVLEDSKGLTVNTPIQDLNLVTTIKEGANGTYIYTNETGEESTIDITGNVIENITEILSHTTVKEEIYTTVAAQGKQLTALDSSIEILNGEQAVLQEMQLAVADKGITTKKMAPGEKKHILITNAQGEVEWVEASDHVIIEAVKYNETVTVLVDHNNGTLSYYNEKAIDAQGQLIADKAITFDSNTLRIVPQEQGKYAFFDGRSTTEPVGIVDVTGTVIENITEILNNTAVKEEIYHTVAAQGKSMTSTDQSMAIVGGEKAGLAAVEININTAGVTTDKIKDQAVVVSKLSSEGAIGERNILVSGQKNEVVWRNIGDIIKHAAGDLITDNIIEIVGGNGENVVISDTKLGIRKASITNKQLTDNTIRIEKLNSKGADEGMIMIANAEGGFDYVHQEAIKLKGEDLQVSEGLEFSMGDGKSAVLEEMGIRLKDEGIEAAKLAQNAVTTKKIKNNAVTTPKIADWAVTEDKLYAGENRQNYIPVAQEDGSVRYEAIETVMPAKTLTVDNSLEVKGNAAKALLEDLSLQVKEEGIGTSHIQNLAITPNKISSSDAEKGMILTADGSGNAQFDKIEEAIAPAMHGDIVTDGTLHVKNGENVLFGDENTQVTIKINEGGVEGRHISTDAVTNEKIVDRTIEATKLTGGSGGANRVATTTADGGVEYKAITAEIIESKGQIKTDGIITASDNGVDKVLAEVTLGIADQSIPAVKFTAGDAPQGAVATVTAGGTVAYQALDAANLANKGTMTTDEALIVSDGVGKVLADVQIGVKEGGITNDKVGEQAITANKLSSEGVGDKRVLISGENAEVFWGELGDVVSHIAGNLTTDGIVTLQTGTGENTLLADAKLGIADQSITSDKLSSKQGGDNVKVDFLLVTDGKGGFDYVEKEAVQAGGVDLNVGTALEFIGDTTGKNAVLAPTTMDVRNQGISTAKLADAAVTTTKISAEGAKENEVLTANGNGTVSYKAISNTAFEGQGANLLTDGSIQVNGANQALLKETNIAIARSGVENQHLRDKAVTTAKIGSEKAKNGTILTADGSGNTTFKSLTDIATTQGKAVTSNDKSLAIASNNKAALQDLDLSIASEGVKNGHIGNKEVTAEKIGATGGKGKVLTTDGDGGASFESLDVAISAAGKTMQEGAGIHIEGGGQAALKDVTISVADLGINTAKLANGAVNNSKIANKAVTNSKIDSEKAKSGQVLTADGSGGASWTTVTSSGGGSNPGTEGAGDFEESNTIQLDGTNGSGVFFKDLKIKVKNQSIDNDQIKTKGISVDKIYSEGNSEGKVLASDGNGGARWTTITSSGEGSNPGTEGAGDLKNSNTIAVDQGDGKGAIFKDLTLKVKNNSIEYAHLKDEAVYDDVIKDQGVHIEKINAEDIKKGYVMTADGYGGAHWTAVSVEGDPITEGAGDFEESNTIEVAEGYAQGALFNDVRLEVKKNAIKSFHIDDDAVGFNQLQRDAVYDQIIKDKGVPVEKIDSDGIDENHVLVSDGDGGARWEMLSGGGEPITEGAGDFEESDTIEVVEGYAEGALFNDVRLEVKESSIKFDHLTDNAVYGQIIKDQGIPIEKIDSDGIDENHVLVSDGEGGVRWEEMSSGGNNQELAMPKFFYLPAIYLEIVSGQSTSIELYDQYEEQFGSPMLSSLGNGKSNLPIYGKDDLIYYVTYYDKNVFENVQLDYDGELHYTVKNGAKPTGRTFFNVVLEVK